MEREYDIVLFGASGYTGKYTAESVARLTPVNLRWAVAGRTLTKLESIVERIKPINLNRKPPAIEICSLDPKEVETLVRKTSVVINTVGPFSLYGETVVKACAENGTHYLDATGEVVWVHQMIQKYEEPARKSHAIIVPQSAFESAMSDLLTLALVKALKDQFSAMPKQITVSVHDLKSMPSGGTLTTMFSIMDVYSPAQVAASMKPYALSPRPGPPSPYRSFIGNILGTRKVPGLGLLTTSITGTTNAAIVQRSWGLLDYGPQFAYDERMSTSNRFFGFLAHWGIAFGFLMLAFPPFRWLVKRLVWKPGEGPSEESTQNDRVEVHALAETDTQPPQHLSARSSFNGSMYDLTGVYLTTGAMTILQDNTPAKRMGGGILTPATLGQGFIDRAREAGVALDIFQSNK